jgi:hypothetical protein
MALTNYNDLNTAIAQWLNRTDLTSQIPDFISLAESEMSRRLRRTSIRASMEITGKVNDMPCEAAELRSIYLISGSPHLDFPLNITTPEGLAGMRALQAGNVGRPRWAAIMSGGKELVVAPAPDQTYEAEVHFFAKLVPLSYPDNEVNNEFEEAPDMYLYGALAQAEPFLEHDERMPMWKAKFDAAIDQLNDVRDREEHNASLQPVNLPMVFG